MPKREVPVDQPEEARAKEAFAREQELSDLKQILQLPLVRDFLWRFMEKCRPFSEQFNPNFGVTGHNLGWRAACMWMWNEISEADFEALLTMQAQSRQKKIEQQQVEMTEDEGDS